MYEAFAPEALARRERQMVETLKALGPNGFIEFGRHYLTVENGRIYRSDMTPVGILHDDGFMQGMGDPLGPWDGLKTIEELPGVTFKGIDSQGLQLLLPGTSRGPTGGLLYNKTVGLNVIFGRIATQDHRRVGFMADDGTMYLYDQRFPGTLRKLDENSQLATTFQGIKSNGTPWQHEFTRSIHRAERTYWENEVMRYFEDISRVNDAQKNYVFHTMRLYAQTGLLQIVRKKEGVAGLGNVKHGAAGVTGVRSGNVTLDRDEFENEVGYYKRFSSFMIVPIAVRPYQEVRLNLVVAHEYGHQLEFCLTKAMWERIDELHQKRDRMASRLHPLPEELQGGSEYLLPQHLEERIFISGYSRSSWHEYWAEAVGAFAVKEGRDELRARDPEVHQILCDVILQPEKVVSVNLQESLLALQASLRLGGEFPHNVLEL